MNHLFDTIEQQDVLTPDEKKCSLSSLMRLKSLFRTAALSTFLFAAGCQSTPFKQSGPLLPSDVLEERELMSLEESVVAFREQHGAHPLLLMPPREMLHHEISHMSHQSPHGQVHGHHAHLPPHVTPRDHQLSDLKATHFNTTIPLSADYFSSPSLTSSDLGTKLLLHSLPEQRAFLEEASLIDVYLTLNDDLYSPPKDERERIAGIFQSIKDDAKMKIDLWMSKTREEKQSYITGAFSFDMSHEGTQLILHEWPVLLVFRADQLQSDLEETVSILTDESLDTLLKLYFINESLLSIHPDLKYGSSHNLLDFFKKENPLYDCDTINPLRYMVAWDLGIRDLSSSFGTSNVHQIPSHAWLQCPLELQDGTTFHWLIGIEVSSPGKSANDFMQRLHQFLFESHSNRDPLAVIYESFKLIHSPLALFEDSLQTNLTPRMAAYLLHQAQLKSFPPNYDLLLLSAAIQCPIILRNKESFQCFLDAAPVKLRKAILRAVEGSILEENE